MNKFVAQGTYSHGFYPDPIKKQIIIGENENIASVYERLKNLEGTLLNGYLHKVEILVCEESDHAK
jgi:hypothetical protein